METYKKESAELCIYCVGGSDKTQKQINNTPHLYRYVRNRTYAIQVMNAIAYPCFFETVRFPTQDKAEHFHYVSVAFRQL